MATADFLVRCPRCGASGTGRFCSACGASLDPEEGSLGGELKSNFTKPLIGALAFIKTMWLLLTDPRVFCQRWLNGPQAMDEVWFPLEGLWKRISSSPQRISQPLTALAVGLALIAAAGAIEATAWKIAGLGAPRKEAEARQSEGIQAAARLYYGHEMKFVKLEELTGFAPLDAALKESWHLIGYAGFAALIAAFMPKQTRRVLAHPRAVMQYFIYAVAAGLFLQATARVLAALFFAVIARGSLSLAMSGTTVIIFFLGYLPMIWLGAILPIVIFPRVIPISAGRVAAAVIGGFAAMGTINVVLTQLMLRTGVILL